VQGLLTQAGLWMLILDVGSLLICLSIVPDIFVNTWILHRFYLTYFKFHPSLPKMSQLWCIFPSQPVPLVSLKQDVWRSAGDESKEICIIGQRSSWATSTSLDCLYNIQSTQSFNMLVSLLLSSSLLLYKPYFLLFSMGTMVSLGLIYVLMESIGVVLPYSSWDSCQNLVSYPDKVIT
jgi:hypothetical protein